jgi:hypothetical protein
MTKKEIKIKSKLFFLIAFFAILFLFGFVKTENVEAAEETGYCFLMDNDFVEGGDLHLWEEHKITRNNCEKECDKRRTVPDQRCYWKEGSRFSSFSISREIENPNNLEVCKNVEFTSPSTWFNCILLYVLRLMGTLLELSATLFNFIMEPENIRSVINNPVIYKIWAMVRDALNIVFILFLLFSAFATVFQIEKYSYKNILKMLIIMALLVNFSFPITRFIIDLSNVLMYYIADTLVMTESGGGFFATITRDSALGNIIYQNNAAADTTSLLASIIFVFIMAITLLVVALLLVIRTIALAILIIFSSLGFVGQAIPQLSGKASEWWSSLFKYAFFGPIMLFMLYIASQMMAAISQEQITLDTRGMGIAAISRNTSDPGVLAAMSFYVIPIIILWIGIGMAQKMGVAGADAITGNAKNFMKGAGRKFSGYNFGKGIYDSYKTRRSEAKKDSYSGRVGTWLGSKTDQVRGVVPLPGQRDAQLRYERDQRQKVEEEGKRNDTANASIGDLQNLAANGNQYQRAAAIQELANKGEATGAQLIEMGRIFGDTSQVFRQLASKIKAYDPVAAFTNAQGNLDQTRLTEHLRSNQFDAKKLNVNSLGNADFMELAFQEQAISNNDLEELRKKSIGHESSITRSLTNMAGRFNYLADTPNPEEAGITDEERTRRLGLRQQQRINRNVQMAHFAQTGRIHDSIEGNPDYRNQIFQRLNKDTMKRINGDTVNLYAEDIAANMNISKYSEALPNIEDRNAQRNLNRTIMDTNWGASGNVEAEALREAVRRNPKLRNIR